MMPQAIRSPTPQTLHWLAGGQLANRLHRAIRNWWILNQLYGKETQWGHYPLKDFTYSQLRDRLFAETHPKGEKLDSLEITAECGDFSCICHRTCMEVLETSGVYVSESQWQTEILQLTGINPEHLEQQLQQRPFATVHRSIRDDLKQLSSLGWLEKLSKGKYECLPLSELPTPPEIPIAQPNFTQLSIPQTWELLHVLESVAFLQPNLNLIIENLWQQIAHNSPAPLIEAPHQRIFLHLDYILSTEAQDQVDDYQEQIEQLWGKKGSGVIQFEYWVTIAKKVEVTVYPVCLHYHRRAKYLSAYGTDPEGQLAWHNYRLDRIASEKLRVLPWGDPSIPKELKEMRYTGKLPTPAQIQTELDQAWGFNFYLKRELLILRFPSAFAQRYVDNTFRHPTFRPISYKKLPQQIIQNVPRQEQQKVLDILQHKPPTDAYYTGWIRTGDVNVLMRLRDWRPNGEVIAPLSIREELKQEAMKELSHYQDSPSIS
ncbi:TIGR03985 family CRISPR-associated protein [Chrysosporum bergii ANA360D]|jgi:CRISPR-associated protein (TIGR03985 family)|uniref:TIGR03985 family CRISPR-associated protein n=1 Tax=Chrysosporum bergii ANA360D TaxID=617107 RepID=A0AA43KC77_9CYAN|nr:TIGR03985 family CRISPR-associated protein [Chrysosporum bergii]MDH6061259.1 TIGR03985 family CRISPR-associated protein [Chrysosporum bergii ANA360D]